MPLIALVDDREEVLQSLRLFLSRSGMSETATYDAPEALLEDMRSGMYPDLVVTDLNMAGMNGVELLDTINALYGDIPGIIITGYPEGIPSVSKLNKRYPVLCKGDHHFFRELVRLAERTCCRRTANERSGK